MMPLLPHELSDRIIDFLHDDRSTLSAVSLTCRSLLPTARYHRFHRLVLVGGHIEQFCHVLDASPSVGFFVNALVLDSGLSHTVWAQLSAKIVTLMVERMAGLQHLELRYLRLQEEDMRLVGNIHRVHTLSLVGCHVPRSDSLPRLLSSLDRLDHLNIEDLSYAEETVIADGIQQPHLRIFGATGLADVATSGACAWVLDGEESHEIRSFYTRIRSKTEAIATRTLIERLGGTLTDLQVVVDAEASLAAVFNESELSLGCLTNLRSCRLVFKLREMFVPENMSLPWITAFISQLSSTFLSSVVIRIQADNMQDLRALDSECGVREKFPVKFEELEALDWDTIYATLDSSGLKSLRGVTFEGLGDPTAFQQSLALRYPGLVERMHFVDVECTRNI